MMVRLTSLAAVSKYIPAPFDVTLAAGGTKDLPIHVRDIVEYRANPARTDNLREIEQMIKSGYLLITVLARDPYDFDLEEMLLGVGGSVWNQKGSQVVAAPLPVVTVLFPRAMPGLYRVKSVILEGVGGGVPFEIQNLVAGGFDVSFGLAPWVGTIHWEIEYPA